MKIFSHLRFWLELIALPFFIFLVIHLAGHGSMILTDPYHSHEQQNEVHEPEESHEETHSFFSQEFLFGILFLCIFVWIWHRPFLKKWIPCQHEHCHGSDNWLHIIAIIAFCLHFFPEAQIRHQLLENFSLENFTSIASIVGFFSHFLVDIIVAFSLSTAFSSRLHQVLSFGGIIILWVTSLYFEGEIFHFIPHFGEGVLLLISGFLLAMFIHKPHKPKKCQSC